MTSEVQHVRDASKMQFVELTRSTCADKVAIRGGSGSGFGGTCPSATRCDKVTEPSALGHSMTSGAPAI